mmetsp:Transcript_5655/g.16071  ORF Transcript_5655/g.16071 Transcript_5655/m.16071 type:complete len:228 (-) Transcript_5655:134-817(-)
MQFASIHCLMQICSLLMHVLQWNCDEKRSPSWCAAMISPKYCLEKSVTLAKRRPPFTCLSPFTHQSSLVSSMSLPELSTMSASLCRVSTPLCARTASPSRIITWVRPGSWRYLDIIASFCQLASSRWFCLMHDSSVLCACSHFSCCQGVGLKGPVLCRRTILWPNLRRISVFRARMLAIQSGCSPELGLHWWFVSLIMRVAKRIFRPSAPMEPSSLTMSSMLASTAV